MKRILVIVFLLIIIIVSFAFLYLRISASGSDSNYFNKNLRFRFSESPLLRDFFGLHYDGDARYDYLGESTSEILIEIDSMEGLGVPGEVTNTLAEEIEKITNKKTSVTYSNSEIPRKQKVSSDYLREIKKNNHFHKRRNDTAGIYILVASSSSDSTNKLGSTLEEDGLVFFQSNLAQFYNVDNRDNYEKIILGTLLHEFGHQLGLGHNEYEGCLMNSMNIYNKNLSGKDIIFDFCEVELQEISRIRKNI